MTETLGDYEKHTGSGGHFMIWLFTDGSLIEWDASESPEQAWTGTWRSGAVKYDHITTHIGTAEVRYEPFLDRSLLGLEDGIECVLNMTRADMHRLQGYPR